MVALVGAMSVAAAVSPALDTPGLAPGSRLRLRTTTADRPVVGALVAQDEATITLQAPEEPEGVVVRRDGITKVEVSVGRHSRGRGALLGAAVGPGIGAAIGVAGGAANADNTYGLTAAEGGVALGVLGASVGALIGLAVTPGERWNGLPLDHVRLTLAPVRGRGGMAFVAFVF
jgi:hypothetical protein